MNRLQILKPAMLLVLMLGAATTILAHKPPKKGGLKEESTPVLNSRADCVQGSSRFYMDVNNVRAVLLSSGDVWWDLTKGVYEVPKVDPTSGVRPVSAIFAGAVWLGGKDAVGNLKVACQTYRDANSTDFWPGPLKEDGTTSAEICEKWDKHFVVTAEDINIAINLYRTAVANNPTNPSVDCAAIPESVRGWPADGNKSFASIHQFSLPRTSQGLAKFFDRNRNGEYQPCDGDYPIIDVKGCETVTAIPDQMVFWIYNDNGGIHTNSQRSRAIQMEVQVQAFAYKTNDELNDMTFQRYKLINRALTDIDSTYFAMWVDPDLGCFQDDYIGCDTTRNLMYVYNQDAFDGVTGCVCATQTANVATYCDKIPILGVDYFRGPNNEFGKEIGMTAFTYNLNGGECNPLPGTTDPETAIEYYNYLTGSWRDGTPFTFGGSGYNPGGGRKIKYSFIDAPNNQAGWSMCTANLPCGDRRTIQASGPFRLKPGAINELIIGVPFVADQSYPCPDIRRLQEADDIAQALFNNCFKIFNGPDAPDMHFVELDREIIMVLTNKTDTSLTNNAFEKYAERGLKIPPTEPDSMYTFQGYKVYQLHDANVSVADFNDPAKARLVSTVDVKDGVGVKDVFNWKQEIEQNFGNPIFIPELKLARDNDKGIRHSFKITEDLFARTEDKKLVNHKKYYFTAIAFGYNNYKKFDARDNVGQKEPYVVGRRNIGDASRKTSSYEVIPRPIVDTKLGSKYGDGPVITRLDGVGNGGRFLDISEETLNQILAGAFDGSITYKAGAGPIQIAVYNPLEVVDGQYELTFRDKNMTDAVLEKDARWQLKNAATNELIVSETTIEKLNEQIIAKFGFSVTVGQVSDAGLNPINDKTNGAIGSDIVYKGKGAPWLTAIQDDQTIAFGLPASINNFLKTNAVTDPDFNLDPNQALGKTSNLFAPYQLMDYRGGETGLPLLSPAWQNASSASVRSLDSLSKLNNVDIVFTSDKSKWSRCVVVETSTPIYYDATIAGSPATPTEGIARNFDLRKGASVGKDAGADGKPTKQVLADEQAEGLTTGMGWFPGYAVDVETGKRLNVFFGENSSFDPTFGIYDEGSKDNSRDMIWNPTSQVFLTTRLGAPNLSYSLYVGGQHYVYVTNTEYDACKLYRDRLNGSAFRKIAALRSITWAGMPYLRPTTKLTTYAQGLIPSDATVKLRVNNPYAPLKGKNTNNIHPSYRFDMKGVQATALSTAEVDSTLNVIGVVPNPYYGFSAYEVNSFSTTVKITNLPAKSTITIYTLDGKYIRQFKRDEKPFINPSQTNPGTRSKQIAPDLEWDLKNEKGIPIASGVYLINVNSELGQRTLKFFAVNRQFDPSRL
jgi:hypothetical protein